ncbi:MAG: LysR substrate-binding domain-containing protein, partial [Pseudomonadales bacterium]
HPGQQPKLGPSFGDSAVLVRAALEGRGLALTRGELTMDELASGRLVKPFEAEVPCVFSYYLVYVEETTIKPAFLAFREWLFDEAGLS